jgi:hypothetical protein
MADRFVEAALTYCRAVRSFDRAATDFSISDLSGFMARRDDLWQAMMAAFDARQSEIDQDSKSKTAPNGPSVAQDAK